MKSQIIAHLREKDRQPQPLWDHLSEASAFAERFAGEIGLGDIGQILGLVHDLGKASREFQSYLGSNTGWIAPDEDGYMEDAAGKKGQIDHSSAGAQVLYRNLCAKGPEGKVAAQILSLCVASHHSGLIDCLAPDGEDNFTRRIEKSEDKTHADEALGSLEPHDIEILQTLFSKEIGKQILAKLNSLKEENDSKETLTFKYGLLTRFLFSCLIDADRLSTIDFESPGNILIRNDGQYRPWEILIQRLDAKLSALGANSPKTPVNLIRNQVSEACLAASTLPQGIYQLTVPTGGGKTLASLRFALHHAHHHHLERIFYVIPYTSIIDQNAQQIREILEDRDDNGRFLDRVVLEHHSNLTPEEETRRQGLLSENWDAPIVLTTQVQFLEALFGGGTRGVRRMHQLANAVIIFDEVQTLPIRCVHMFNVALRFLTQGCGATVILCTATQPLLDKIDSNHHALTIQPNQKIIPNEGALYAALKRTRVYDRRKIGGWGDDEVADLVEQELSTSGSVLAIVNTRKSARSLYAMIEARKIAPVYHLSTNMCPAHRLKVLDTIKSMLGKQPVICVSTQLIEAGVDIDFGSTIRYLAGLDSIAQAAGRCNRNGLREYGNVWIVNPKEENITRLTDILKGKEVAERVLDEFGKQPQTFGDDLLGLKAMEEYYQYYFYQRKDEMGYRVGANSPAGREDNLFNLLSANSISVAEHQRIHGATPPYAFRQSFQTAGKAFRAIDSPTRGVIVPYGEEGKQIIADLCGAYEIGKQYRLIKKAQRYSVNLLPHELKKMGDMQAIHEVQEGAGIFYMESQFYNAQFGWSDECVNEADFLIFNQGG